MPNGLFINQRVTGKEIIPISEDNIFYRYPKVVKTEIKNKFHNNFEKIFFFLYDLQDGMSTRHTSFITYALAVNLYCIDYKYHYILIYKYGYECLASSCS